jgi:N-methylhydantoinase A
VGPESAGADPGPVCYGRGGTVPTVTDCNLALGYLDPAGLAGGSIRLDAEASSHAVAEKLARPLGLTVPEAAMGMLKIAASTMMRAIRAVSVERGRDVRACSMMAFGGNGPLFAASIARELGIARVIVPPMPGLFSAFGLLLADTEHHLSRSLRKRTDDWTPEACQAAIDALRREGSRRLSDDGFPLERQQARLSVMARYVGQSSEIQVPLARADLARADARRAGNAAAARPHHARRRQCASGTARLVRRPWLAANAGDLARHSQRSATAGPADRAGIRRHLPGAARLLGEP